MELLAIAEFHPHQGLPIGSKENMNAMEASSAVSSTLSENAQYSTTNHAVSQGNNQSTRSIWKPSATILTERSNLLSQHLPHLLSDCFIYVVQFLHVVGYLRLDPSPLLDQFRQPLQLGLSVFRSATQIRSGTAQRLKRERQNIKRGLECNAGKPVPLIMGLVFDIPQREI